MNRPMHPALPRPALWRGLPPRAQQQSVSHARTQTWTLLALTCVGFALRVALIDAFPLREDEAIYGFWARTATADPFFLHTWPDKPPLFIWLLQGAFALFGPSAASARLVSIFASVLTIPLVAWGARRLWQSPLAALFAAMLMTFSPFAVSFAPTAYTDSLLVLLGTGAVVAALNRRGFAAGLLLGAACMTKQQGLFYAPLVIALVLGAPLRSVLLHIWSRLSGKRAPTALRHPVGVSLPTYPERPLRGDSVRGDRVAWARVGWALMGAASVVLPILWWDSQRWAVAPSPWVLGVQTYAPLAWLPPQQWLARGAAWSQWLWYLGGSWTVWLMLGAALTVALGMAWRRRRSSLHLALLLGWGIAFVALHLISNVQAWDRYLLPLAPWLALVTSGPLALVLSRQSSRRLPDWLRGILFILLMIGMVEAVLPGVDAAKGQLPIGGDHGDYAGLTAAMAWVEEQDGPAILYHQVLGWHFRFYLYDEVQPVGETPPRFDLRWFPSAVYLADNAAKSPYPPKYLVVPAWATPRDLALHLAMRGLVLEPRLQVGRFAVMEIIVPPRPLCDWCQSSLSDAQTPVLPATLPFAAPSATPPPMSVPTTP